MTPDPMPPIVLPSACSELTVEMETTPGVTLAMIGAMVKTLREASKLIGDEDCADAALVRTIKGMRAAVKGRNSGSVKFTGRTEVWLISCILPNADCVYLHKDDDPEMKGF